MKLLLIILSVLIGGRAEFDRTVHDFGVISKDAGPQNCQFTVTNTGEEPLTILSAISSCGCTNVKWTRKTLEKGEKGTIEATYTNEDGPYPFDKTITVYLSDIRKPVVLHLRGVVK
jgi:hypothetical protein